jgi:anti-sigma regulatory factor (Ser/Thr protein kinase)
MADAARERSDSDPLAELLGEPRRRVVLAAPADGQFTQVVREGLAAAGWEVLLVHAAADALGALDGAALLILDTALADAQRVLREAKLNPDTNPIPAIAIFPRGNPPLRPTELQIQADLELTEPFVVHQLLTAAEREAARCAEAPALVRTVRLILPSSQADLDQAAETAARLLQESGLGEADQASLIAAFREAVGNAIQHGNLRDPAKCVRVEFRADAAAITIEVRDEGPGFDHAHYLRLARELDAAEAARDRSRRGGLGGLGIPMLVRCTDQVEYNEQGNAVTLTKLLRPDATDA